MRGLRSWDLTVLVSASISKGTQEVSLGNNIEGYYFHLYIYHGIFKINNYNIHHGGQRRSALCSWHFRGSNSLFWLPLAQHANGAHTYICAKYTRQLLSRHAVL